MGVTSWASKSLADGASEYGKEKTWFIQFLKNNNLSLHLEGTEGLERRKLLPQMTFTV